jgi:hypothetical protein
MYDKIGTRISDVIERDVVAAARACRSDRLSRRSRMSDKMGHRVLPFGCCSRLRHCHSVSFVLPSTHPERNALYRQRAEKRRARYACVQSFEAVAVKARI